MAVHAFAVVKDSSNISSNTDYAIGTLYYVNDGSTTNWGVPYVNIPFGTESVHAKRLLREAIAADILSNHSLVIDPSDIYFPQE